jgi:hypothetical protein
MGFCTITRDELMWGVSSCWGVLFLSFKQYATTRTVNNDDDKEQQQLPQKSWIITQFLPLSL